MEQEGVLMALKITCYADPYECKHCMGNSDQPAAWCTMYDRPCTEIHIDMIREDGEE